MAGTNDFLITDIVARQAMDQLKDLNNSLAAVKSGYMDAARELSKGITLKVDSFDALAEKSAVLEQVVKKVASVEEQLQAVYDRQARSAAELVRQAQARAAALDAGASAATKAAKAEKEYSDSKARTTNEISRELAGLEKEKIAKNEQYKVDEDAVAIARRIIGTREENAARLADLTARLSANAKAQKDLSRQEEEGTVTAAEAAATRAELIQQEQGLKIAKSETLSILKMEEKEAQAGAGSYGDLTQKLSIMRTAYKQLNQEEKNSSWGTTLASEIAKLDAQMKDMDADIGQFQRNVGNYAIAGESVKAGYKELVTTIATLTVQYRMMNDEEKASAEGQALTEKIQAMTAEAAKLKDAIADSTAAISNMASDTSQLQAVTQGINLLVSGFGSCKAAAQLLGIETEDLAKIQTSLISVLTISNTLTQIQNALQKQSALMIGLSRIQLAAHNKAIALNTAAQGKNVVATAAATVAQRLFNAVANSNPYVLLAIAILSVVGALSAFAQGTGKAAKAQKELNEAQGAYRDLLDDMAGRIDDRYDAQASRIEDEIELMKAEGASVGAIREKEDELAAVRRENHEANARMYEEDVANLENNELLLRANEEARLRMEQAVVDARKNGSKTIIAVDANTGNTISMTLKKAEKQLESYNDMVEQLRKGVDRAREYLAEGASLDQEDKVREASRAKEDRQAAKEAADRARKVAEEEQKAIRAAEDARIDLIQDEELKARQKMTVSYARQIADLRARLKTGENLSVKAREALSEQLQSIEAKMQIDLAEQDEKARRNALAREKDAIEARLETMKGGTEEELEQMLQLRKRELEIEADSKLSDNSLSDEQRLAYEAKYESRLRDLYRETAEARLKLREQEAAEEEAVAERAYAAEQNELKRQYAAGKVSREQYDAATARSAYKYSRQRLKFMIDELQKELAQQELVAALSDEAVKEMTGRLRDYQAELDSLDADHAADEFEKLQEKVDKSAEAMERSMDSAMSGISSPTNDTAAAFRNLQDTIMDLVDEGSDLMGEMKDTFKNDEQDMAGGMSDAMSDMSDATDDASDDMGDAAKNFAKSWTSFALKAVAQVTEAISQVATAIYDAQISAIEDAEDANSEQYDAEVERIEALEESGAISSEEAEARKRAAKDKSAAKEAELEAKKQALEQKEAKYQKAADLVSATTATAVAVMQCYAKLGPIQGAIMSAVIAAIGAAQIATILATPLASYAEGTEDHPGGPALVGEAGRKELVLTPGGGAYVTPDEPTLVNLPRHARVLPELPDMADLSGLPSDWTVMRRKRLAAAAADGSVFAPVINVSNEFGPLESVMGDLLAETRRGNAFGRKAWMDARMAAARRRV